MSKPRINLKDIWLWFVLLGPCAKCEHRHVRALGRKVAEVLSDYDWERWGESGGDGDLEMIAEELRCIDTIEDFYKKMESVYGWARSHGDILIEVF